ncbi:hypothetical protein CANCADRAFT_19525, partial [Tortispora caseinolytica NRRL Y-17796]
NPYFDPSVITRPVRPLKFNEPGKYLKEVQAQEKMQKLAELKQKVDRNILEKKAREDLDPVFKLVLPESPPAIEWWDREFYNAESYEDAFARVDQVLHGADGPITTLVLHPVPIPAPWERNLEVKPMPLTEKEQKRLRRQTRAEKHQEQQDRIRLGLDPPPPPKVKLSNLMNVLTSEAIRDPTEIEARVRREVEARRKKHEDENHARMLSPEERRNKEKEKIMRDAEKETMCAVYVIRDFSSHKNQYKVTMNAKQRYMTGLVIIYDDMSLVVAEGDPKSLRFYKRLMLHRIKWSDNSEEDEESHQSESSSSDISGNCRLVWEGQIKQRTFSQWVTRVPRDRVELKEVLDRNNVNEFW